MPTVSLLLSFTSVAFASVCSTSDMSSGAAIHRGHCDCMGKVVDMEASGYSIFSAALSEAKFNLTNVYLHMGRDAYTALLVKMAESVISANKTEDACKCFQNVNFPDCDNFKGLNTMYRFACPAIKVAKECPGEKLNVHLLADTVYDCIDETACSLCRGNEARDCNRQLDRLMMSGEMRRLMRCTLDAGVPFSMTNGSDFVDLSSLAEGFTDGSTSIDPLFDQACSIVQHSLDDYGCHAGVGADAFYMGAEDWDWDDWDTDHIPEWEEAAEGEVVNLGLKAAGVVVGGFVVFWLLKTACCGPSAQDTRYQLAGTVLWGTVPVWQEYQPTGPAEEDEEEDEIVEPADVEQEMVVIKAEDGQAEKDEGVLIE